MVKKRKPNEGRRNNRQGPKDLSGTNKIIHDGFAVFGIVCVIMVILLVIFSANSGVNGYDIFNKIIDSVRQLFVIITVVA